jgi:NTP pyrophosphatase (non-canonical NTP hydrolase)
MANDYGSCPAHEYGTANYPCTCEKDTGTATKSIAGSYTFDNYQQDTGITAIYPGAGTCSERAVNYAILGLIGEAGEIANKWKKLYRDAPKFATHPAEYYDYYAKLRETILDEIGDVLYYAARGAEEFGSSFGEVAAANIRKLGDRKSRNVIRGSGDNR